MILATLCYIKKDGKTLMLHRIKKNNDIHANKWNGLGGKMEKGETPEDGVIREVREESGLIIKNPHPRGLLTFPEFDGENDWYAFVFTAYKYEGNLIDSNEGRLEWIEDEQLLNLPLWEGDRIFLPWLEEKAFFSGRFIYKNGKLKGYDVCFYY